MRIYLLKNYLRMRTYREYYEGTHEEFLDSPAMQRMHIVVLENPSFRDQLLSNYKTRSLHWMLRQFLMCHADTNLVSTNWVAGRQKPYPNFNTKHTCRDFNAIVDWAWNHQIPIKPSPKPAGVHELLYPP